MDVNAAYMRNVAATTNGQTAGSDEYEIVKSGGEFDMKLGVDKTIRSETTTLFYRQEISSEQYGNMMFGYTGRALGLPNLVLAVGALVVAPDKGHELSEDLPDILYGCALYDAKYGGENPADLPRSDSYLTWRAD